MKMTLRLSFLMSFFILMSCQNKTEEDKKEKSTTPEKQEVRKLTENDQLLQNLMYAHQTEKFQQKDRVEFMLRLEKEDNETIKTIVKSNTFEVEFPNDSIEKEDKLFARLFTLPHNLNYDDDEIELIEQKEIDGVDQDVFKIVKQSDKTLDLVRIQTQSNTHLIKSITLKDDGQLKKFIYRKYISVSGITIPIQIDYYQGEELIQQLSIQRISFK